MFSRTSFREMRSLPVNRDWLVHADIIADDCRPRSALSSLFPSGVPHTSRCSNLNHATPFERDVWECGVGTARPWFHLPITDYRLPTTPFRSPDLSHDDVPYLTDTSPAPRLFWFRAHKACRELCLSTSLLRSLITSLPNRRPLFFPSRPLGQSSGISRNSGQFCGTSGKTGGGGTRPAALSFSTTFRPIFRGKIPKLLGLILLIPLHRRKYWELLANE